MKSKECEINWMIALSRLHHGLPVVPILDCHSCSGTICTPVGTQSVRHTTTSCRSLDHRGCVPMTYPS